MSARDGKSACYKAKTVVVCKSRDAKRVALRTSLSVKSQRHSLVKDARGTTSSRALLSAALSGRRSGRYLLATKSTTRIRATHAVWRFSPFLSLRAAVSFLEHSSVRCGATSGGHHSYCIRSESGRRVARMARRGSRPGRPGCQRTGIRSCIAQDLMPVSLQEFSANKLAEWIRPDSDPPSFRYRSSADGP